MTLLFVTQRAQTDIDRLTDFLDVALVLAIRHQRESGYPLN
ncbi:MAG TPA: hypothetical protein VLJ57_05660 [Burkholderiaceae bacterium]|nr:hypothetical protein [Burkholderiaceae bacterium]